MSRPLIGVSVSEMHVRPETRELSRAEPSPSKMVLGLAYMRAVERSGGIPVALSPLGDDGVEALLGHLSGILLSGGPDLDPSFYGAAPHAQLGATERDADAFELALCRRADELGLPILGICRGAQLLNVARGGTLHQHLPDIGDGTVEHRQSEPGVSVTHSVSVLPDSVLAGIAGAGPLQVNSFHHQGIDRLGRGMRAVAWSQDGLIEAVEDSEETLLLGVQWHAETLIHRPEQLALFARLVEAARAVLAAEPA